MQPSRLPARSGVGFKPQHFSDIIACPQPIGFFEVHADNYMGARGLPHHHLTRLRQDYSVSIHGVGLSIGSMRPLDQQHLTRLKVLCDRYEPESFSEHLAWSSHGSVFLNDLLPLPYTEETLAGVCAHVDEVQAVLKRQMLLENPATYLLFAESTIPETEFLAEIARRTGCGLLFDINNVFVASTNHRLDPRAYMAAFPLSHVREIHLGGHETTADEMGAALLIDTHDKAVAAPVWSLFAELVERTGAIATLVEWDDEVPAWPVLRGEAERAQAIVDCHAKRAAA
jgi:uncharacterized protein (UPF0276 family)